MDSQGKRQCGGDGCGGLVTLAHSTWQKAQDFEKEITSAMEEVEKLSEMVRMCYRTNRHVVYSIYIHSMSTCYTPTEYGFSRLFCQLKHRKLLSKPVYCCFGKPSPNRADGQCSLSVYLCGDGEMILCDLISQSTTGMQPQLAPRG